ncbi:hypothetical protein [Nonomuraea sp. NPDC050310]|uniref:hypothetical protein n=1 Tax=Nonomuraea sp. NPDC050310 TaxID=3154935 RepID=UPI003410A74E
MDELPVADQVEQHLIQESLEPVVDHALASREALITRMLFGLGGYSVRTRR